MEPETILITGLHVVLDQGRPGYYKINAWMRTTAPQSVSDQHYEGLTWPEVLDVVTACLDESRPGEIAFEWYRQPTLF